MGDRSPEEPGSTDAVPTGTTAQRDLLNVDADSIGSVTTGPSQDQTQQNTQTVIVNLPEALGGAKIDVSPHNRLFMASAILVLVLMALFFFNILPALAFRLSQMSPFFEPTPQITPADKPETPAEEKPPIDFLPMEKGRIFVGALDGKTFDWNGDAAGAALRELQGQRPGLRLETLPRPLRHHLEALVEMDSTAFPGDGTTPGGGQILYLLVVRSRKALPLAGPTEAVSVGCEIFVLSAAEPKLLFNQTFQHTGHGSTAFGAFTQAIERCASDSANSLP